MEAAWTVMTKETDETSGVLPAPTTSSLLDYLNHTEKMFMVEEMDDLQGIMNKAEFFRELTCLDLERETLDGNTNQA